jgi:hypothetical protein
MVNLTPKALTLLKRLARNEEAVAGARFNLTGSVLAEEERDEWTEAVQCLEQAILIMPRSGGNGRRRLCTDRELLEAYAETGTLEGTAERVGYWDSNEVRKRFRLLGVKHGLPGRPKRRTA